MKLKPAIRRTIAGAAVAAAAVVVIPTAQADTWPAGACQQFHAAYGFYPAGACDSFNGNPTTTTTVAPTTTIPPTTTTTALPPEECRGRADGVTGGVECP